MVCRVVVVFRFGFLLFCFYFLLISHDPSLSCSLGCLPCLPSFVQNLLMANKHTNYFVKMAQLNQNLPKNYVAQTEYNEQYQLDQFLGERG